MTAIERLNEFLDGLSESERDIAYRAIGLYEVARKQPREQEQEDSR